MSFLKIPRKDAGYRPVLDRIHDYGEVEQTLNSADRMQQSSRCMDCGVPFCHWACPVDNRIPEWQAAVAKGKWREAYEILASTNDFPEFTGRICPAPCEKSCVLNINHEPVTCRENEVAIIERAFLEGWVVAAPPTKRFDKRVAVVGSGPAGLAAANQLNLAGYHVTVFEKDESAGGLLRFGIPDFKLQKDVIDRRITLMEAEGVNFVFNTKPDADLLNTFDAVAICIGAGTPRNLLIPGRELSGIHFALDLLQQQNRVVGGVEIDPAEKISAKGKHVLVIGGGDTGSDCVGTSARHGAEKVTQIEIMPKPPVQENPATPWPLYPNVLKTSSSHEEGCERRWNIETIEFRGEGGAVKSAIIEEVEWKNGAPVRTGKREEIKADLVLLSMGFVYPEQDGLVSELAFNLDGRKNIATTKGYKTSVPKFFAAGDCRTGASLVVRAIAEGRRMADEIASFLKVK